MEFAGQKNIINYINNVTLDDLPHSLIFAGERGSGKHSICNKLSTMLNIPLIDITENISLDNIMEMYRKPSPYLYLVDINNISEKEQNSLLKILEESYNNTYLVLLSTNSSYIIPTIKNRCTLINLEKYSDEELSKFIFPENLGDKELILSLANTPGQVIEISSAAKHILELSIKIVDKIGVASFPNTLTLSDKLSFKNEKSLLNPEYVLKAMSSYLVDKILTSTNELIYVKMIKEVSKCIKAIDTPKVNRRHIFENFLTILWKISRSE